MGLGDACYNYQKNVVDNIRELRLSVFKHICGTDLSCINSGKRFANAIISRVDNYWTKYHHPSGIPYTNLCSNSPSPSLC